MFDPQLRRSGEKTRNLVARERPRLPGFRFQPKLLMLGKFTVDLDEITLLQCAARFVIGMIVPDPQRHSIAGVGEADLAIRFPLARGLGRRAFDLGMDTGSNEPVLGTPPSFADRKQFRHCSLCGLRLGYANDPAGKTTTGVPGRLGFQIIGFFVDDDCMTNYRISARKFHYLVTPFEMGPARRVRLNVA